ncbi:MAG: flagellar hook-associated protein FlgK [Neomegalonema sp.]
MTISNTLATAISGLSLTSKRAEITSNNVANALTEGYARRNVESSEQVSGGAGQGVRISGIQRAGDPALTGARRIADADVADSSTRASAYQQISDLAGDIDDPYSIFSRINSLENSLAALAQPPESADLQSSVVRDAQAIAFKFNEMTQGVDAMRSDADADIAKQVEALNADLAQLQILNNDIKQLTFGGGETSALEDERQRVVDRIGSKIAVKTLERDGGAIDLVTPNGLFLMENGAAREVEFTVTPIVTAGMEYDGGAGVLSGITINGRDVTPGGPTIPQLAAGSLAAAFAVRDEIAPGFAAQIDGLARDLAERFQDPTVDPTLGATDPGLFTDAGAFVDGANETGFAARIAVNAAVDPDAGGEVWRIRDGMGAATAGPAGNGDTIRSMLEAMTDVRALPASVGLTGLHSASGAASSFASLLGSDAFDAEARATTQSARADTLKNSELSVSAVDTDQELALLLEIERLYSANARVIQTADNMMQQLLEL